MTKRQDVYYGVNDSEDCHPGNYDPLNRPVEWENTGATDNPFARNWYQYDSVGREVATWRDEQGGKGERFEYDPTNQLKKVSYDAQSVWTGVPQSPMKTQDYVYTPDRLNRSSMTENGVVTSYAANAMNQYTVNGATYNYDGNFNLREAPNWGGDFDAQNHLRSAGHGGNVVFFTYDGLGRCVRRQVFVPSGASTTVLYTYDDWNPIIEWDQGGNFAGWNMYGHRPDEILMRFDPVRGPIVYKQDQHGDVVALLDQWGNIVERYGYEAFGKPKVTGFWDNNDRGGSLCGNRFMFQGREWIAELGIYDYRHRVYSPELGRFLQTDPTGFDAGDMNLFRYCGDDPVDRSDPMGLEGEDYTLDQAMRAARALVRTEAFGQKATYDSVVKQTITHGVLVPVLRNGRGGYELGRPIAGVVERTDNSSGYRGYEEHEKVPAKLLSRLVAGPHSHQDKTGIGHPKWSRPDINSANQGKIVERVDESNPGVWHGLERTKNGLRQYNVDDSGNRLRSPAAPNSNPSGGSPSGGLGGDFAPSARDVDLSHQATGVPSLGAESVNSVNGRL